MWKGNVFYGNLGIFYGWLMNPPTSLLSPTPQKPLPLYPELSAGASFTVYPRGLVFHPAQSQCSMYCL